VWKVAKNPPRLQKNKSKLRYSSSWCERKP
jgi:hypothetical protein